MTAAYRLDVVVPCYNEADVLPVTLPTVLAELRRLVASADNRLGAFRLLAVNDGSRDATWAVIERFASNNTEVEGIGLSRNCGHQLAMLAGLSHADADAVVTMDADLQDDIGTIERMLAAFESGADLALGVRIDRSSDQRRKRWTAQTYYRLLLALGVRIVPDHADFRLMSRRALAALLSHGEVNLFLRGLIPSLGFNVTLVPFVRNSRELGSSKYTLRKMFGLAIDGITSFSVVPLRLIAVLGLVLFGCTVLLSGLFLWLWLIRAGNFVPGWASIVLPMLMLGGVQLLSIGVLGEYIGKVYLETKRRPRFIVQETTFGEHR